MGKQILRKKLSSRIEGNKEIVEFEYYALDDFLTKEELNIICDIHGDDTESAYDIGIAFDFNDDLIWIDCDRFALWTIDYLADNKDEDSRGAEYDIVKNIKEKMEKYIEFTIWF